ncbi:MAG TPA: glycosyltransferase family 4 protein, partial [Mycobacteriales bacterium]|nr:glycosyltransferase family 4 protein [Mycobacteriales bacterium]
MTLVVTGHLAPRHGGVETVTEQLARRLPTDRVVVMAPRADGDREVDRTLPFEVIRYAGRFISRPWLAREVAQTAIARRAEAAWITSAMPLGALAVPLRRAGVGRIVVTTHGMEIGWARVPPAAALMRWVAGHADVVTYLGEFTHTRLTPALPATVETVRLTGGVDATHFAPTEQSALRERLGLADRPVVVSASRLVPRKGQDMLIRAWPMVQRRHPGARLLIVGDGRRRQALARLAAKVGVAPDVVFAGGAALDQLPAYLGCGDVFALPCRDVWAGLQVEGLGLSILEASAVGLPVVAGRSGGSPDAVRDGVTGLLV